MRRFFYDTEFIEYPGCIDLVSIGIVSETGEAFYAISTEFDRTKASKWVKKNVLAKLPLDMSNHPYMTRDDIKKSLLAFLKPSERNPIELWAYYADYDHVALCWIFGTMMDLPEGMPMYTRDIKQLCDSLGNPKLPKQNDLEHNALDDAKWNYKAYQFLCNVKKESAQ